ncbi:1,4-alpha-glucan branching enzyme [Alteribacillus persepolensis]|uniref:1,4-alpha-glucan branching enzyme GlgB n=1 Tax=Alteribacillus persepolensis TaxID=568899 RepID=A0A1G8DB75_9BACI|nr:1,4-alpha-glucan branching protein GlgB [Alteribacillus persepolensis]SDH54853.1 1,4-alpha-glucan branching enzyme [Alteribacillus persepolensis]
MKISECLKEDDIYLFHQGTLFHSHHLLGAHPYQLDHQPGYRFAVWAPHAARVCVAGDFNNWNGACHPLEKVSDAGLWAGFIPHIQAGAAYKYEITAPTGQVLLKSDPYAFQSEIRPATASITRPSSSFLWSDNSWQKQQQHKNPYQSPLLIYELHAGTWKKKEDGSFYSYRELADLLVPYVKELGYTHIELLPLSEHPFDGSWGYQISGYYSVTSRYGSPDDFKYFINTCHHHNIGVIMDWVPGHFCKDDHGLRLFDGEPLYEYEDKRKAEKTSWGTLTFDFGRPEVQSFLISNAIYWFEEFHIDGLRTDAVASMLYLNFDKNEGEDAVFNSYGGDENLEALAFLQKLNKAVFHYYPSALMMAEESSAWPLVSAPVHENGLGFNFKWNMGWMNDILQYMKLNPIYRKYHHELLTFSHMYTYSENYLLPFSHDEVVHGKKSLLNKMPGDQWQKFAQLRLLLGYMMAHPGKKLLFMGAELAQYDEWKDKDDLDWELLQFPLHQQMHHYVKELNHFYQHHAGLYDRDHEPAGFTWIDPDNHEQSILVFCRHGVCAEDTLLIICNFTPVVHYDFRIGVTEPGSYKEIFNSDLDSFGGSHQVNDTTLFSEPIAWHNQLQSLQLKIPPFAISILKKFD